LVASEFENQDHRYAHPQHRPGYTRVAAAQAAA
jgi:hypothetical protein